MADPCGEGDNSDQSHDTAGPAVPPMHADGVCIKLEDDDEAPCYETRHMADTAKV